MHALILVALLGADGGTGLIDPFRDLPEVTSMVPLAGELQSMGVPVMARAVRTKLSPQLAQRWVVGSFRRHGLYIPPPERQYQLQGAPQVTGYDPVSRRTYTALFKDNGDGSATVVCGTADLTNEDWAKGTRAMDPATSLPLFPAAQQVVESKLEGARSVSYLAQATATEVTSFYAEVLGSAGWAKADEGWTKGTRLILVQQTKGEGGKQRVVVLERTTGGAR